MIKCPLDVLHQFPVRKSGKQKQAFRDAVQSYAQDLQYPAQVEKEGFGARNVIIGNPKTARYLITAHYDTPAGLLFSNLITPCNAVTFILYQFFMILLFFAAAVIPGVAVGVILDNSELARSISLIIYWALLLMMILGPANKKNANDNTSGVVTVLETAAKLPENLRDKVCFVLFDLEEAGLIGSSAYAKKHKNEIKGQMVLNCDCVGDGDELMMFPTRKVKKNKERMESLRSICRNEEGKTLSLREKGFAYFPSDQRNFPFGVGIAAFRRSPWAGLYCSKIHTKKDTVLDENNVSFLRDRLIALIQSAAQ